LREPLIEFGETGGVDSINTPLSVGANRDELGLPQHFEMLRDGGSAYVEVRGNLAGGQFAASEHFDDLAACGIGQRGEGQHAAIIAPLLK
jgi:hypothetical protein